MILYIDKQIRKSDMKKLTIWKENFYIGAEFSDENGEVIIWEDLTKQEQLDFIDTLDRFAVFFRRHIKDNDNT